MNDAPITLFLAHLRVERGLSPHTLAAYTRDLARYRAFLTDSGVHDWADVTPAHCQNFIDSLTADHLAPTTVGRVASAVRSFHSFMVDDGALATSPATELILPELGMRLPKALSIEQVTTLLSAPSADTPTGLRDRALMEFLYATGCRISEALAVCIDDVGENMIRVFGKGGKERIVPLGSYAREAIDAYLTRGRPSLVAKGTGTPYLFVNTRGKVLSRQSAFNIIHAAGEAVGLGDVVSPHTFRHSCATHLLTGGADIRIVQELLGHANVTTTQIYTKVTLDSLREAYVLSHPRARRG